MAALACRYGHQPLPVVLAMTMDDADTFISALAELISRENARRED